MGLFDFLRRGRSYEIHALKFCEVGKDGKRDSRPESRLYNNARYVMPVARLTSRVDHRVEWTVRLTAPDGRVVIYDVKLALHPCENRLVNLPTWGSEAGTSFQTVGWWRYELLDGKGNVLIEAALEIVPAEELWDEQGWIRLESDFEFGHSDSRQGTVDDWGATRFTAPRYMAMRCRYSSLSDVEREVTYEVEIRHEQTGQTSRFDHTVTLHPAGGWLQLGGWGSDSGHTYESGRYTCLLCYEGRQVGSGQFEVERSARQRGWIVPMALVLYLYNDEEAMKHWVAYDCGQTLIDGGIIRQLSFGASAYTFLVAGFQWRSLEAGHPLKLTFRFYLDDRLVYDCTREAVTREPNVQGFFDEDFEISGILRNEGSDGAARPLPKGRYRVELHLETEELHNHFVMQRSCEVR